MSPSPRQSPSSFRQPPHPVSQNLSNGTTSSSTVPQPSPTQPQLASLANAGLKADSARKDSKTSNVAGRFEAPVLTGAAAMADEQRLKEESERQRPQLQSPNPVISTMNTLRAGALQAMSQSNDSSRLSPLTAATAPHRLTTTAAPDAMQVDQTSPTSMSSHEELRHAAYESSANRGDHSSGTRAEGRSNKALTYPPPPPADPQAQTPARGMSLPNAESRKSSGVKKHKCPHCATEFTRHHNLKSHLLTHSQEKPYACQQCSAKFRRLHDLKRHTKLHTGERPHICNKCGRKFARGDALARHNKGPGGCAGRRGSFDDDGFGEGGSGDEGMEDVVYANNDREDGSRDSHRRQSEPGHHHNHLVSSHGNASPAPYRQHSSTYPGVAAMSEGARVPHTTSSQVNSRASAASYTSAHFAGPTTYSQSGITESPGPLSPAPAEPQRQLPSTDSSLRDRSSSLTKAMQTQHMNRGVSQTASPMSLPPLGSQPPQLPPLSGLVQHGQHPAVSRNSLSSSIRSLPPSVTSPHPILSQDPNGPHSNAGSASSSHKQSSGASLREHLANQATHLTNAQNDPSHVDAFHSIKSEMEAMKAQFGAEVARLREENASLRSQLQQQNDRQHAPPPR